MSNHAGVSLISRWLPNCDRASDFAISAIMFQKSRILYEEEELSGQSVLKPKRK